MADATVDVAIVGDASGFHSALSGVKSALGGLSGMLGGLSFVGLFGAAIKEASDAETGVAQLNAVLKSTKGIAGVTKDSVLGMANSLQKVTRFSDDAILSGENMLLTFTNIGKDVFPNATQTMLDMSQALGQDVKNSAMQLGKALNDPVQGITALRRVGVAFTADQERMIKTLVRQGKTMEAQKIILRELNTEFGGSAKAAGETFAGKLDILHNAFNGLLESIGGAILPALSGFVTLLTRAVDAVSKADPGILALTAGALGLGVAMGPLTAILGGIAAAIAPILVPIAALAGAFAAVKLAWDADFGGIRTAITSFLKDIQPQIQQIQLGVQKFFEVLNQPPKLDLAGLDAQQQRFTKKMAKLGEGDGQKQADFGVRLKEAIDAAWPIVEPAVSTLISKAVALAGKLIPQIVSAIGALGHDFGMAIKANLDSIDIGAAIKQLLTAAGTNAQNLMNQFVTGIAALGANFGTTIATNLNSIDVGAAAKSLLDNALTIAGNFINNATGGIAALGHDLGFKIADNLKSIDVGAAAKSLLDGAGKVAGDFISGIVSGIAGLAQGLIDAINAELDKVLQGIQAKANEIAAAIAGAITGQNVTVNNSGGTGGTTPIPGGVGAGADTGGGTKAHGKQRMLRPEDRAAIAAANAKDNQLTQQMQQQLDSAVSELKPPKGLAEKISSFFSADTITTALTTLGSQIATAMSQIFGADGAIMAGMKPFEEQWTLIFGAGGSIGTAIDGLTTTIDSFVTSVQNISTTGGPAITDFEGIATSAAPGIVSSWEPVVGVFEDLARSLDNVAGKAQRAVAALGGVGGAGAGVGGARAGGGPVQANTAYIVGESGPELFVPNSSGSILPNSVLSSSQPAPSGGGGGGGNLIITGPIYVSGVNDPASFYNQMKQEAMRRNASVSKVM